MLAASLRDICDQYRTLTGRMVSGQIIEINSLIFIGSNVKPARLNAQRKAENGELDVYSSDVIALV